MEQSRASIPPTQVCRPRISRLNFVVIGQSADESGVGVALHQFEDVFLRLGQAIGVRGHLKEPDDHLPLQFGVDVHFLLGSILKKIFIIIIINKD